METNRHGEGGFNGIIDNIKSQEGWLELCSCKQEKQLAELSGATMLTCKLTCQV
jgi:hypothetical protein